MSMLQFIVLWTTISVVVTPLVGGVLSIGGSSR